MRYNDIFEISILLSILLILFIILSITILKSSLNIILTVDINNININIKLNIKYLFGLINIKIPIYPIKNKRKTTNQIKAKTRKINKSAIEIKDLKVVYKLLRRINIQEFYSNIKFGNENVSFTSFMYVFINTIYGNIINIINPKKIYLKVDHNFTKNYISSSIKIHIKPTIKDILSISIAAIKIYNKIKIKDGGSDEINKVNTKSYGDNT